MIKKRYFLIITILATFLGSIAYQHWLQEFCPFHIYSKGGLKPEMKDLSYSDPAFDVEAILNQPFSYIGQGGQSFAFSSEDQQYVIKFFRFSRVRPAYLVTLLPKGFSYRENHIKKWKKKLAAFFTGHQVAFECNRKRSGLKYLQLSPNGVRRMICLVDKNGDQHRVDLGKTAYVIQVKGEPLENVFHRLFKERKLDEIKVKISNILDMYLQECQQGIYDRDLGVMHNLGFVGDQPLHLDVGKFEVDEEIKMAENSNALLEKIADKMCRWVAKHYPEHEKEISDHTHILLPISINNDSTQRHEDTKTQRKTG